MEFCNCKKGEKIWGVIVCSRCKLIFLTFNYVPLMLRCTWAVSVMEVCCPGIANLSLSS